jgi:hypothetical protein
MIQDDYGNLVDPATASTINARLDSGDARMTRIESELSINTKSVQMLVTNTADLVMFFESVQGALRVLNWLGALAKPLGYIAALVASIAGILAAMKGGK